MLCHRNSHEGLATGEALAVCAIQPFDHATLLATDTAQTSAAVSTTRCGDTCPIFPGKRYEDWQLNNPEDDQRVAVDEEIASLRQVRQDIEARMRAVAAEHGIKTHVAVVGKDSPSADGRLAVWQQLSDPEEAAPEPPDLEPTARRAARPQPGAPRPEWQAVLAAAPRGPARRPVTAVGRPLVPAHPRRGQHFWDAFAAERGHAGPHADQENLQER